MPDRLLFIAFHFPPVQGSTGVTRTLSFAKYLRESGWDVTVLTAHARAYPDVRLANLNTIPTHVQVERAFALDTRRHLSLAGRYPLALAVPDRWQSWIAGGLAKAASVIRSRKPAAIMSTYPIASAHYLGYLVHRMSGLPWIADFRDPMLQDSYPPEPLLQRAYGYIERKVFSHAARVTVTTKGTADLYRDRFPQYPADSIAVIPNGFDEAMFTSSASTGRRQDAAGRKLCLLHSGVLYPSERDPTAFFSAVAELRDEGRVSADAVEFRLRATGHDELYTPMIQRLGLEQLVRLEPAVPYTEALAEMCAADACMIFQGSNCNQQVPAKLYEYLYADRPILALTDSRGDTARLLSEFGITDIASLDDKEAIKKMIPSFLEKLRAGGIAKVDRSRVMRFSRRELTRTLGILLDELVHERRVCDAQASGSSRRS